MKYIGQADVRGHLRVALCVSGARWARASAAARLGPSAGSDRSSIALIRRDVFGAVTSILTVASVRSMVIVSLSSAFACRPACSTESNQPQS